MTSSMTTDLVDIPAKCSYRSSAKSTCPVGSRRETNAASWRVCRQKAKCMKGPEHDPPLHVQLSQFVKEADVEKPAVCPHPPKASQSQVQPRSMRTMTALIWRKAGVAAGEAIRHCSSSTRRYLLQVLCTNACKFQVGQKTAAEERARDAQAC